MNKKIILYLLVLCPIMSACTSVKQMKLFNSENTVYTHIEPQPFRIAAGDELQIRFSSLDAEAVNAFNSAGNVFLVSSAGTIDIPVIGRVSLLGMTQEQAQVVIEEKIRTHTKNAMVLVKISNAGITVLGEVRSPKRIIIDAPVSLISAIGMVGDFTSNARRDEVMVQRLEGNEIKVYKVNMLSDDVFKSPCYYLQKGDVIYVSPLHSK